MLIRITFTDGVLHPSMICRWLKACFHFQKIPSRMQPIKSTYSIQEGSDVRIEWYSGTHGINQSNFNLQKGRYFYFTRGLINGIIILLKLLTRTRLCEREDVISRDWIGGTIELNRLRVVGPTPASCEPLNVAIDSTTWLNSHNEVCFRVPESTVEVLAPSMA